MFKYLVNGSQVMDSPRFSHRGILIDTSRHYIAKSVIKVISTSANHNVFISHENIFKHFKL